jgi:hypothetical protein
MLTKKAALTPEEQELENQKWRARSHLSREMQIEAQRRELSVSEAHLENPGLMPEYEFRRAKVLLDAHLTPDMVSAALNLTVEAIHEANQVYGFIDQTAKERQEGVLNAAKERGVDTTGMNPGRNFPYHYNDGGF